MLLLVYPNVIAVERQLRLRPADFRLWVCLHEVTHRTQFTGKPWLRSYFLEQVNGLMTMADPDPARFFAAIGRVAEAVRTRRNPLDDGGIVTLFATAEQRHTMDRVGGLMSLLEGHGDVTMDRAGGDRIPSAGRFGDVLRTRRSNASAPARLLQKLMGIEAKLASLGLRIRKGCSFHGLALNINMDMTPFLRINPCGYAGMAMTQTSALGGPQSVAEAQSILVMELASLIGYETTTNTEEAA